jgi:hypothetical protein
MFAALDCRYKDHRSKLGTRTFVAVAGTDLAGREP